MTRSKSKAGSRPPEAASLSDTLARLGIVCVPMTMFEWGGYRYTNASDAIAAARRAPR